MLKLRAMPAAIGGVGRATILARMLNAWKRFMDECLSATREADHDVQGGSPIVSCLQYRLHDASTIAKIAIVLDDA